MAEQYVFQMYGLNKYYGQKQVLKDINLSFFPDAKIGIVGENGSGKSTLLRIMAGLDTDFLGHAEICKSYRAGIVLQEPDLDEELTVRETLLSAFADINAKVQEYNDLTASMGEPMDDDAMEQAMTRMGDLQDELDSLDAWNLDSRLSQAAEALCLPDDERVVGTLSGGERRRVALCKVLLERPDLLLLDEPTNHLDAETVDWLEAQLKDYPGCVIVVTHDRYFLDNITKWILELDNGRGIPWEGSYSSWLAQKLERLASEDKKETPRKKSIERELAWIRMSNQNRNELSRTRLIEYEKLVAREAASRDGDGSTIQIAPGPELGGQVIEVGGLAKGFDGSTLLKNLEFKVPKGAVVGLVGPNGMGKTTLFKLLVGDEAPDAGTVTVGESVAFAYVDQNRASLLGAQSLLMEVNGEAPEVKLGKRSVPIRQYLSWFGFKGSDQQKSVDELSGGERNRLHLAKTLKVGGNVLLLDEPTNDLDVNTLRLLEDAILDFPGCVMVISHDRFFLDRICTHLLVFEGQGAVRWFTGNYQDYESWRTRELGEDLFGKRRTRYRRVV